MTTLSFVDNIKHQKFNNILFVNILKNCINSNLTKSILMSEVLIRGWYADKQ
jgi:hypothetical protein